MTAKMYSELPTPIHIIQDSRFAKQDGWRLNDISLCSSGNIAVSGDNYRTNQSYVCIYSSTVDNSDCRDKPTLLYNRQFTHKYYLPLSWLPRCISFLKSNAAEIVTCRYDEAQVIDYNQNEVLRYRTVNGSTSCLSVSEGKIFIGLDDSDIVNIYDNDLKEIKSIRLEGIQYDYAWDMSADRLYVCTYWDRRAIAFSQGSGGILDEFSSEQYRSKACSIAADVKLGLTAVLWNQDGIDQKQISFYLHPENKSYLTVKAENSVYRIRLSNQGRIVTGIRSSAEVKIYNLASLFSYRHLKESLVSTLGRDDCEKLTDFFAMSEEESNNILNSDRPATTLLLTFEEKGVLHPSNVGRLLQAFHDLKMSPLLYLALDMYHKLRDQITSYDRFLATLSAHLISSVPAELCDYFHISDEEKDRIISSQNSGLSLLLVLDEMGVIKPSDVGRLEEPFYKFRLKQAVAKIHHYQVLIAEEKLPPRQMAPLNTDEKMVMFVDFLKKKIKSWYETMTPVPWKTSCKWESTDLFVCSGLILTDSKTKQSLQNIDERCKLNYTEIFTHEKLKSEIRIILEGDPGTGKTMLSSQLAYDWSEGRIDGVDILIFLPLKIVEDKTLIQAIKDFYIPENAQLSVNDILGILANDTKTICLLLDGLEEYSVGGRMRSKESSEVINIMKRETLTNCKVVITSRSSFAHYLPECPLLKIGRFGETERNSYIEKLLPGDLDKQQRIKRIIQDNPFILDICSVPLLFVLAVHNIESMRLSEEDKLNKVSPFMRSMILTLCFSSTLEHEVDGIRSKFFESGKITVAELAFKGLCKGHQQLSWPKDFVESNVSNLKSWINSGILIVEEGFVIQEEEMKEEIKQRKHKKKEIKRTQKQRIKGALEMESPVQDLSVKPTKEEKDKKAQKCDLVASNEMLTEDVLGPSTSHDMSQLLEISKETIYAKLDAPTIGHDEVTEIEQPQSVSELVIEKNTELRAVSQVPLVVKFLHKVVQEWFAATFFCSMMRRCSSEDQFQNYACSQLHHISPTDLHYVLRFTSYLYPPSCHVVIDYLLRSYRKDGHVPPYIMNCIFLCFNEHNDDKGPGMRNAVIDVCKEVITIQSEDSRLLQQAKVSLLDYASLDGITVKKLELKDVIVAVNDTNLTLNSGIELGVVHTVKAIEVTRWDQVLQEKDYKTILRLLSTGTSLKHIYCIFPSQPPELSDEITLENVKSKDLKAEWHIGNFVLCLDPKYGKWMPKSKQICAGSKGTTLAITNKESKSSLERKTTIWKNGGVLEIPTTGVVLLIPPNALPDDIEHCEIQVRIIPRETITEQASSFSSNSSTVVELLPDNLKFQHPVRLTLPHCLVLQGTKKRKARIFVSHHRTGCLPKWEEYCDLSYVLEDTSCTIFLYKFCWVKISIDDDIVIARKIVVYTAATKIMPQDEVAEIAIGYCPDLPEARECLQTNPNLIILHKKSFYYVKREEKHPLRFSLECIILNGWQLRSPQLLTQEISYGQIASRFGCSFSYIFEKSHTMAGNPLCVLTVSQEKGQIAVQLTVRLQVMDNDILPERIIGGRGESSLRVEKSIDKAGGKLEIPGSGVILDIPPGALEDDVDPYTIHMSIIPTRQLVDQVTSFCTGSSTAVEIFPSDLRLKRPAKLSLPHCLMFKENVDRTARIFINHGKGSPSYWEELHNLSYVLNNVACIIQLDQLCSVKYSVDDTIVTAKIIKVYTAAKRVEKKDEFAEVEVGYYPDIPGGGELLRMNPNFPVDSKKEHRFLDEDKLPLQISLKDIAPTQWIYRYPQGLMQVIPFRIIASSIEHSHLYVLQKTSNGFSSAICLFTASQVGNMQTMISLTLRPQQERQLESKEHSEQKEKHPAPMNITFQFLSRELSYEWLDVGRALGVSDSKLNQIQADKPNRTKEAIYQMLLHWKQATGAGASYSALVRALETAERKDLADRVQKREEFSEDS